MPDEFHPSIKPDRRLKYMHAHARRRALAAAAKADDFTHDPFDLNVDDIDAELEELK